MLWEDNRAGGFKELVRRVSEYSTKESKQDSYGSENRRGLLGKGGVEEDWRS